jgi:hypothetical protein
MKLYRFLKRGWMGGRIIEPGEEVMLPDDVHPGAHMIDVAAEAAGTPPAPGAAVLRPVFRADLAHNPSPQALLGMPPRLATESDAMWAERVRLWDVQHPTPSLVTRAETAVGMLSPDEARAKNTEEAMKRAEATRIAEAKQLAEKTASDKAAADKVDADKRAADAKLAADLALANSTKEQPPVG